MVGAGKVKHMKKYSIFVIITILLMGTFSSVFAQDIKLSLEPEKKMYQVGDKIIIKFRLDYPGEYRLI